MPSVGIIETGCRKGFIASLITPEQFKAFLANYLGLSEECTVKENDGDLSLESNIFRTGEKESIQRIYLNTIKRCITFSGFNEKSEVIIKAKIFFSEKWIFPKYNKNGDCTFEFNGSVF